jgi:hypothetical protein
MARRQEQEALPGIPAPPKRKVIEEIEDISLEIDKMAGKRTAMSDAIAEKVDERREMLRKHKLGIYTYEDEKGILRDVVLEDRTRTVKSKLNPAKSKKGSDE